MKKEVIRILKSKGLFDYFNEVRYKLTVEVMKHGMTKDLWLKEYLSLDPLNKAEWISDHLIIFVDGGHLK